LDRTYPRTHTSALALSTQAKLLTTRPTARIIDLNIVLSFAENVGLGIVSSSSWNSGTTGHTERIFSCFFGQTTKKNDVSATHARDWRNKGTR
jgi:hypothetical protein